jgi:LPS export ABC transporter protein LptC
MVREKLHLISKNGKIVFSSFKRYVYVFRMILLSIIFTGGIVFVSCSNDLEIVQSFKDPAKVPKTQVKNIETFYYDSAKLLVRVTSPNSLFYKDAKEPYLEFPSGIHVEFYDSIKNVNAEVTSKYAIYYEAKELWEARKDVVVISKDGKQLKTEQLFWDRKLKIIYSNKFCRVTTSSVNLTGNKFTAKEDFSTYELKDVQGPLQVKDE